MAARGSGVFEQFLLFIYFVVPPFFVVCVRVYLISFHHMHAHVTKICFVVCFFKEFYVTRLAYHI